MSVLADAVISGAQPDTSDLQAMQAPQVTMGQDATGPAPQLPPSQPQQPTLAATTNAQQPTSRLAQIMMGVTSAITTGLSSIPDKGRPNFVSGLGAGARAGQAAAQQAQQEQAQQQQSQRDYQLKTMDDAMRAHQLAMQDLHLQYQNQAMADAHESHMQAMHANDGDWGIEYDSVPNNGQSVNDYLKTQTTINGAASIPPGTHISGDGQSILIPKNTPETQAGQLAQFKAIAPALGIYDTVPNGATKLDPKVATAFYNKLQGFDANGNPYNAGVLPALIAGNKQRLADLQKQGAPQIQIDALSGIIKKQQAHLDADNAQQDLVTKRQTQAKEELQDNAASNKPQKPVDTSLDSVAFDPNYQNPDGSKGANIVMSKADAAAKGLTHYKADPNKVNATVAGMNDVQNKLNQLADVVNDPSRFGQVQPGVAAAMLTHGSGISLTYGAKGASIGLDTSSVNERLYKADVAMSNQATRDYVTAMVGAHEAITQLPRLQTFGQSSRMTQAQQEAAQNLLPQPGDGSMAAQKMSSLQGMIDPLRKQIPHMPGAESIPSWKEKQAQQSRSNLSNSIGNPVDVVNRLQTGQ